MGRVTIITACSVHPSGLDFHQDVTFVIPHIEESGGELLCLTSCITSWRGPGEVPVVCPRTERNVAALTAQRIFIWRICRG